MSKKVKRENLESYFNSYNSFAAHHDLSFACESILFYLIHVISCSCFFGSVRHRAGQSVQFIRPVFYSFFSIIINSPSAFNYLKFLWITLSLSLWDFFFDFFVVVVAPLISLIFIYLFLCKHNLISFFVVVVVVALISKGLLAWAKHKHIKVFIRKFITFHL